MSKSIDNWKPNNHNTKTDPVQTGNIMKPLMGLCYGYGLVIQGGP